MRITSAGFTCLTLTQKGSPAESPKLFFQRQFRTPALSRRKRGLAMTLRHLETLVVAAVLCVTAVCTAAKPARVTSQQEASTGKSSAEKSPLDYEYFKTKVQPIFVKKRGEHARCYACHSQNESFFHLQRMAPGSTTWTEEQTRLNFRSVSHLVTPGDTEGSVLLLHPLAPEAGGDSFHSGGRQFESKDDPDWKTMAEWIRMAKPSN
jgi:hypothetical protein